MYCAVTFSMTELSTVVSAHAESGHGLPTRLDGSRSAEEPARPIEDGTPQVCGDGRRGVPMPRVCRALSGACANSGAATRFATVRHGRPENKTEHKR